MAIRVPSTVEIAVEMSESRMESQKAVLSPERWFHSRYHWSVKPFQVKLTSCRPPTVLLKL